MTPALSGGPGAVSELQPRPLGRLGRRLLPEIETYLEFFAIARGYDRPSTTVASPAR
jgi:hypothetical protein